MADRLTCRPKQRSHWKKNKGPGEFWEINYPKNTIIALKLLGPLFMFCICCTHYIICNIFLHLVNLFSSFKTYLDRDIF